jgi:hypothetical protein
MKTLGHWRNTQKEAAPYGSRDGLLLDTPFVVSVAAAKVPD